jgi:hypothetical protein
MVRSRRHARFGLRPRSSPTLSLPWLTLGAPSLWSNLRSSRLLPAMTIFWGDFPPENGAVKKTCSLRASPSLLPNAKLAFAYARRAKLMVELTKFSSSARNDHFLGGFAPQKMVRSRRLELPRVAPLPPQGSASTNSAMTATPSLRLAGNSKRIRYWQVPSAFSLLRHGRRVKTPLALIWRFR